MKHVRMNMLCAHHLYYAGWARTRAKNYVLIDGAIYECGEAEPEQVIIDVPIKYRCIYSAMDLENFFGGWKYEG